ncbi:helix-turn-helix domain-containing protein [Geobacillus sp. BMUD]|nr:helix-turn-helix domain-containing protein [Geobacillus sp. BMUD]
MEITGHIFISASFVRRGKFREDEARKSAGTWLVTRAGMERVTGKTMEQ